MNTDLQSWNEAAAGWDSKIAKDETYRTLLISDALNKLVLDCSGLEVLDAGCGNGYFSYWLSRKGGIITGIDGSDRMIAIAQRKYPNINFKVHDLLTPLPDLDSRYDLILANMLLMHMSDISVFLLEAKRLLKIDGTLIVSVLHPCFNQPTARLYKTLWHKLTFAKPRVLAYNYYTNNSGRFESHLQAGLTHYHRPIEEYSQSLKSAGFSIEEIVEPHNLPEQFLLKYPKLEYATRLPRFIFFKCKTI